MPRSNSSRSAGSSAPLAFENKILYEMCLENPRHSDPYVNAGKIILIGRTYAASPQRGAGKPRDPKLDFFGALGAALSTSKIDTVLKEIDLDARIDDPLTLKKVKCAHRMLVELIFKATSEWAMLGTKPRCQPSFASKYLHFHRPLAFPLMDSRAKDGLRREGFGGAFASYSTFCDAILRFAATHPDDQWTPRSLDSELLQAPR